MQQNGSAVILKVTNTFLYFTILEMRVSATKTNYLFAVDYTLEEDFACKAAVVGVIIQHWDSVSTEYCFESILRFTFFGLTSYCFCSCSLVDVAQNANV